jgi:hypothetical protein
MAVWSGTSFATPLVAGAAACLMQARPAWTAHDVARALAATASRASNPDSRVGYGIVDIAAALRYDAVTGTVLPPAPVARLRLRSPNPARLAAGLVTIELAPTCDADRGAEGRLRVIDVGGRHVRDLWRGPVCVTGVTASWDGRDEAGRTVGSGIYFLSFEAAGRRSMLRLVALR